MTLIRPSSKQVRKNIHTDIPSQFPAIYREEGPIFVQFVEAYYKYVDEQENNFRDAFSIRDIDTTFERFLLYFKKKYLNSLPLKNEKDIRFLLKHIQDLYRRKGSTESIELLFRMFFDEEIEIFYPSYNILRISDSKYGSNNYLEMNPVKSIIDYPIRKGDKIIGDTSKAEAFVDEIVFQNIKGLIVPTLYLSNLFGRFTKDDNVRVLGVRDGIEIDVFPGELIHGSISSAAVNRGNRSSGNVVGDKLILKSNKFGIKATASVSKVSEAATAVIDFQIADGGWGYSVAQDENIIQTSTVTQAFRLFSDDVFDSGYTPNGASSAFPNVGDYFISDDTYSAGTAKYNTGESSLTGATNFGYGQVVGVDTENNLVFIEFETATHALITTDSDLYQVTADQTKGFDVYFYDKGYQLSKLDILTDFSTYVNGGNVGQLQYFFEETVGNRQRFDITGTGSITAADYTALDAYLNAELTSASQRQWIKTNIVDYLLSNLDRIIGGRLRSGDNVNDAEWYWTAIADNNFINASEPHVNPGAGYPKSGYLTASSPFNDRAKYRIGSIKNAETVSFIPDIVGDFLDVQIVDQTYPNNPELTNYGMSGTGFENINTRIRDAFSPVTYNIGEIDSLVVIDNGELYQADVKSLITLPDIAQYDKRDVGVIFKDPRFIPSVGDVMEQTLSIEQFETGEFEDYTAKAKLLRREGDIFYFRPITFYTFVKDQPIKFRNSNFEVIQVLRDETSKPLGQNALIDGEAQFARGQIEEINVLDTGFRYADGELIEIVGDEPLLDTVNADTGAAETIANPNYGKTVATSNIRVLGTGFTESDWLTTSSFLNDPTKVIHDNFYYQEYSFDVRSIISPDVYEDIVADVVQPAGTKLFGSPLINTTNYVNVELDASMEIYNFNYQTIAVEVLDVITDTVGYEEANVVIDELVATLQTLDEELSTTITEDIND